MEGGNSNTPLGYIPTVGYRYYQIKKGLEEVTLPFFSWSLAFWSLTNLHFFLKQSCSPGKKLSWQPGWGAACSPGNHGGYRRTKPGSLTSFNLQDFLQKVWPLLPPLLFFFKNSWGRRGKHLHLVQENAFCLCSSNDVCQGTPFLNPDQAWAWTRQGAAPFGPNQASAQTQNNNFSLTENTKSQPWITSRIFLVRKGDCRNHILWFR